jgi:hypothetical protein
MFAVARIAAATVLKVQTQGLSIAKRTREDYIELATRRILRSGSMSQMMTSDDPGER